jgi:hypothetical protein
VTAVSSVSVSGKMMSECFPEDAQGLRQLVLDCLRTYVQSFPDLHGRQTLEPAELEHGAAPVGESVTHHPPDFLGQQDMTCRFNGISACRGERRRDLRGCSLPCIGVTKVVPNQIRADAIEEGLKAQGRVERCTVLPDTDKCLLDDIV